MRLEMPSSRYIYLLVLLAAASAGHAREIPRTSEPIRVDGQLDEKAWSEAVRVDLDIETRPGENTPAPVETVAYLVEDGVSLYVAFDARDPDPAAIRAYLRDRDAAYDDDFVGIVLDTYNDERRAFEFFANALGVQMDLTFDDVNGNENDSWNAIWESAGQITETGFIVEMRIPLSQLRFPETDGKQTWGIDLLRIYPRDFRYRLSNNASDRAVNCYLCQFEKFEGLPEARPSRDLEIAPTLTVLRNETTDDPGTVPLSEADTEAEVGVTVRWGITPDITTNLTINPDFSQIEADAPQLDVNNQFALFFPETRPFFLEGADYFRTPIPAVFTRTVADPIAGAKITGKRRKNTFGAYLTQDEITNLLIPGPFESDSASLDTENTGFVGRYSRSFGESSTVGALATLRRADDYYNYVGGFDLRWRINDNHNVQLQYLHSETEYPDEIVEDFDQPEGDFDGFAALASYRFENRNWFTGVTHYERSSGFRADSGFVARVDTTYQLFYTGHNWWGGADDWWSQMELEVDWDITHDENGRVLEREFETGFTVFGPMQSEMEIEWQTRELLFNEVVFEETKILLEGEVQPIGGLGLGVNVRWGDQVDFSNTQLGDEVRIRPYGFWNVNRHLLARISGSFVKLDSKEGPNIFDATLIDLRLTWQFNVRAFLRFTTQYQDVERNPDEYIEPVSRRERDFARQLLFSYTVNPQTVFFLGYSDDLFEDDSLDSFETADRTWFAKIGYAWTP